jgi:hypothetical protein
MEHAQVVTIGVANIASRFKHSGIARGKILLLLLCVGLQLGIVAELLLVEFGKFLFEITIRFFV